MRAITVNEYGAAPALMEVPDPHPGPRQILIKIEAAGINPMDRSMAAGAWKERMPGSFPFVLGADLAGVVEAVGEGAGAALLRAGGTALTTRYLADTDALASRGVAGINFRVDMSSDALERLADLVVTETIVVPPITLMKLDDVPKLNPNVHTDGKAVITP